MKSIRKFHYILVFDDLMSQATESPVLFLLLTQGRHRNASVILLLPNMFPQGKFHTDISRNAHKIKYMVLFRSPSDRKQIGIIAERMFDKNRTTFVSALQKKPKSLMGIFWWIICQRPRVINKSSQIFLVNVVVTLTLSPKKRQSHHSKQIHLR